MRDSSSDRLVCLSSVAADTRMGSSAQDIPPVRGLLKATKIIFVVSAGSFVPGKSFVPEFVAAGIQLYYPITCRWLAFIAADTGLGIPAQDISAVRGLLKGSKFIITITAERFVPGFIAACIQLYNPIIIASFI